MATIKQLFDKAWAASRHRSFVKGLLGKPDGAGGYTVAVTGRPGFVYCRVSTAGTESVTMARNDSKVAERANLPVRMRLEIGSTYVIEGVDPSYYSAATADDEANPFGVAKHTHRIGTFLEYEIEPERFEPGRVYSYQEFEVWINAFRYHYNGSWQYWEGGLIDITTYLPTTSTKWGWVLVGIDPETNTAIAVAGAEVATQAELLLSDLDAIAFADYIPCGAIQCAEADTDATDFTRYYDAHAWFTAHLDFNDLNDPSNVTTGTRAAGNSPWAARDDHIHGITDAAVTFVKMQDIATDRLIGRDTASTGSPEELTVGGGLEFTGSGGVRRSALTGDVTASAGSATTTIANDAVTNAKLANMAEATIKGRKALSGTGDPIDLTLTDSASTQWVWASPANELSVALIPGGVALSDIADIATDRLLGRDTSGTGDVEELTVGGGLEFTGSTGIRIADDGVTNAKMANMAQATIKGRAAAAGTGDPTDLTAAQVLTILGITGYNLLTDWSYRNTNRSASAFAWKGNAFTPDYNVTLYAIGYYGGFIANAIYQAAVITGTASPGNISTITKSNTITAISSPESDGGWIWMEFATPVSLSGGTTYGLMFGRTDGADNYALPCPFNGGTSSINAVPIAGVSHGKAWRVAKASPAAGDTIDQITSDSVGMGYRWRYDGSLY